MGGIVTMFIGGAPSDVVTWNSPAAGTTYIYGVGDAVSIPLNATSSLGKSITYTAFTVPTGLSISGSTLTGTVGGSAGSFSSTIRATSTSGISANLALTFNIASFSSTNDVGSVNEGSSVVFTLTGTAFGSGTLYYTIEGVSGTVNSSDFSTAFSGAITITNNSGSLTVTTSADATTEGTETFLVRWRLNSTSGTIIGTSNTITINDTSQPVFDGGSWASSGNILDSATNSVVQTQNAVILGGNFYTYRSTVAPGTLTPVGTWTKTLLDSGGGVIAWAIQGGNTTLMHQGGSGLGRSTDGGASFTIYATPFTFIQVAWNGSVFCACGDAGRIATSSDGITWTSREGLRSTTFGTSQLALCIVWGGGQFVVLGTSGGCATSPDGITWTYRSGLSATGWGATGQPGGRNALGYSTGLGLWVAGSGTNGGGVAVSSDGVNWTYNTGLATAWALSRVAQTVVGTTTHILAFGDQGYAARTTNGSSWTNLMGVRNTSNGTVVSGGQAIFTGSNILYAGNYGGSSGGLLRSP